MKTPAQDAQSELPRLDSRASEVAAAHAPQMSGDRAEDTVVSAVTGDRFCTRCGFNLVGQKVVRERHYQMLMVRCPECGDAAALLEYPALGRWAGRWAAMMACVWFVLLLGGLTLSGAALLTSSMEVAHHATRPLAVVIATKHREYQIEKMETQPMVLTGRSAANADYYLQSPDNESAWIEPGWWKDVDTKKMIAEAGGPLKLTDWTAARWWGMWLILWVPIGAAWSVALPGLRRGRLWIVPLMTLGATAIGWAIHATVNTSSAPWAYWLSAWSAADEKLLWVMLIPTVLFTMLPVWIGALCGRTVVRGLLRLLLPPRLLPPLGILWTCDGKVIPRLPVGAKPTR